MGYKDLTNKKFNRLTVLERAENQNNKIMWKCRCDCGNIVNVFSSNLLCNRTKSCGCLKDEKLIQRSTKHNQRHTKLYEIWKSMKQRCLNPNNRGYKNYGGRGITICDEWIHDFQSFYEWSKKNGYNSNLSIDRIDNNGNYCPENCRWTDRHTQCNNTRVNHYINYNNETKTLADWVKTTKLSYSCVFTRLKKGWSIDKALNTPSAKYLSHATLIHCV